LAKIRRMIVSLTCRSSGVVSFERSWK
jgi:hypothetical protein